MSEQYQHDSTFHACFLTTVPTLGRFLLQLDERLLLMEQKVESFPFL